METIHDVPTEDLGEIVKSFALDGAKKITTIKATNGRWSITAEF